MEPELSDAWSGWASTLLGGLLGALTVLLGAGAAYRFSERARRDERRQDDLRKERDERRAAAAQLMVELSNLRDDVCSRTKGLNGKAKLWPMRNALFTTHVPLSKYPSYAAVRRYYETALAWRTWVRQTQALAGSPDELQMLYPVVDEYREALRDYGDQVIELLQDHLEDKSLPCVPPQLPALPVLSGSEAPPTEGNLPGSASQR